MTNYSMNNRPLSKKLEAQINEDLLMKTAYVFIKYLQEHFKSEKLDSAKILSLYKNLYTESTVTANLLVRRLQQTGQFPRSKIFRINNKTIRLYHIR